MLRKSAVLSLLVMVLLGSVLAKAPTARITITRSSWTKPLVVTDTQLLDSFNPWWGGFLDDSRAVRKPPNDAPYEVSSYVKFAENDTRLKYVFYYRPSQSAEPGHVYLPQSGEKWHAMNASTILRPTGWYFASPKWEESILPLIRATEAKQKPVR
jgi:hypothetical protein